MIEWSRGKFSSLSRASLNQPPVHTSTHSAVSVCTYEFEFCFLESRQSRILRRGWPAENNNRKKQPQKWLPNREDMMTGWRWRDVWSFFSPTRTFYLNFYGRSAGIFTVSCLIELFTYRRTSHPIAIWLFISVSLPETISFRIFVIPSGCRKLRDGRHVFPWLAVYTRDTWRVRTAWHNKKKKKLQKSRHVR